MAVSTLLHRKSKSIPPNGESGSAFPRGLVEFHNPTYACVDIVFIHGLTGDRERTWTHPDSLQPWPREILPALIPHARILTYGYDAYVIGHRGRATRNRIGDHARDFLNELVGYRQQSRSLVRPLIFVVHSLGGLLCKDALLLSRNSADGHLSDALCSTTAIAFMGTPHSGSALARWAKVPVVSLGVLKSSSTSLLSVLQTDDDVLCRIQNDFLEMIRARAKTDRGIEITCFYEALPMPLIGTIVPRESAVLAGFNSISIHGNHRNMVRFNDSTDPGLRSLVIELSRWVDAVRDIASVPAPRAQLADIGHVVRGRSKSPVPTGKSKAWINYQNRSCPIADSEVLDMDSRLASTTLSLPPVEPNIGGTASFRRSLALLPPHKTGGISQPRSTLRDGSLREMSDPGSSGRSIGSVDLHDLVEGTKGQLGLNILFNPKEVMVDLIFVHGLNGGSRKSWSYSDPSMDCWPQTFLPKEREFENCRIHSFGYDSDLISRDTHNTSNLTDFGSALLNSLIYSSVLKGTPETPIVFVCHSIGGLVAKQAYLLARQDPCYQDTAARCHAMVFLSTPHRGTDTAAMLNKLMSTAYPAHPKQFIADLNRNSESLQTINDNFRHFAERLRLFSFYETNTTTLAPGTKTVIVKRDSAVLGYPREGSMPLQADHPRMCKFSSSQDPNYVSVRNVLATIVLDEMRAIREAPTGSPRHELIQVNRFLGDLGEPPQNLEGFKEDTNTASGRWLTSHPAFQRWSDASFDRDSQFLLLHAKPGAGKSVLASRVIPHLELYSSDIGYFFFARSHETNSRASVCLNSIALQLARANKEICGRFLNLQEKHPTFERDNVKEVWDRLFRGVIFKVDISRPFHFVMDAIDECKEASLLLALLLSCEVTPMLRVFMTCRTTPPPDIKAALEHTQIPLTTLEISPLAISLDAEAFISEQIAKLRWMGDDVSDSIAREVLQRSSSCFRWIKLVFEGLQRVHTARGIREVLEGVPSEMAESYKRALKHVSQRCTERRLLASSLAWTVCNTGPLTVAELQNILETDLAERVFRLKEFLEAFCGDFLHVDSSDRITFVHDTAKKFLIDSAESDLLNY
jgi:pimeloyl-ACP methyl ester carboxylesterase